MKKSLNLMLTGIILIGTLVLTGCGNTEIENNNSGNEMQKQSEVNNQQEDTTKPDVDTQTQSPNTLEDEAYSVASFLNIYGMTEEDIKPENFVEFSNVTMEDSKKAGEIGSIGYIRIIVDKDKTNNEQIKAWFEKIYAKMQTLSTDGKLHKNMLTIGTENDKEVDLESLFNGPVWKSYPGTMWAYPYKLSNKDVKVNVSTKYSNEDGEYKISISLFGN